MFFSSYDQRWSYMQLILTKGMDKIMAASPITSWQIEGKTMEIVTDFIFFGSKITVDGNCTQEVKRRLLLGRKP